MTSLGLVVVVVGMKAENSRTPRIERDRNLRAYRNLIISHTIQDSSNDFEKVAI